MRPPRKLSLEYPELRRAVLREATPYQTKAVLIEDAGSGAPIGRSCPSSPQLLGFPYGRHDEQVDSVSQFLAWGEEQQRRYRSLPGSPVSILKESNRI